MLQQRNLHPQGVSEEGVEVVRVHLAKRTPPNKFADIDKRETDRYARHPEHGMLYVMSTIQ